MNNELRHVGMLGIFDWRYLLTPITVTWVRYENGDYLVMWRELYVFGFRLARWKLMAR